MIRFLANENVPAEAVDWLSSDGHDVVWVRFAAPGTEDPDLLVWAIKERRVLLTLDKGFGELAFKAGLPPECGILLLRPRTARSGRVVDILARVLSAERDFVGHFTVADEARIRKRPLERV